eukprot:SAG31_NODE_10091_length_1185_cov_0.881215_2_plen_60_part_01
MPMAAVFVLMAGWVNCLHLFSLLRIVIEQHMLLVTQIGSQCGTVDGPFAWIAVSMTILGM